ncbi:hypothetical protein M409DRAFT_27169 [Zasmidium cellare ATCC 36951]|uniref:BTB domain-containing protein n=1 Tax=Zasmidium cellare ATCC 36951 TaxID=1080233 RepID=A0A6A6C5U9_ZASCE|nr:uncharacterized protein M409DRAFT_27169 [Zasmidium cellare ATCC 36951]KAF2162547.1 hypothetical protein M409DRAFT_27169 [Zasmidium cellare ATCC 36951]
MDDCFHCQDTGAEHPEGVEPLMRQLKSQRLIKIFIGDITEPYVMSETTLVNASEYFVKALKHEDSMGTSQPGVLRFPEDDDFKETWEILLFWLMTQRLPPCLTVQDDGNPQPEATEPWIRMWVLADKYLVHELQDTVMLEMLRYFDGTFLANMDSDAAMANEMLRISPVDSRLRRLVAEETIRGLYEEGPSECSLKTEHLIASDGVPGLSASLLDAYHDYMKNNKTYVRNHRKDPDARFRAWGEYLVGCPPMIHWLGEFEGQ